MKEKEFYKIEALISKDDIDKKIKELKCEIKSGSCIVFNTFINNGIGVHKVTIYGKTILKESSVLPSKLNDNCKNCIKY